jgi:hypothetical protein
MSEIEPLTLKRRTALRAFGPRNLMKIVFSTLR